DLAIHSQSSLVVDPPNGRVPLKACAEAQRDYDLAHIADSYEHHTTWERCITRGVPAGMFPAGYNNAYQILQSPGYVMILSEMIHEARMIPVDGRSHLPQREYVQQRSISTIHESMRAQRDFLNA